jgi:hypothetical protein
MDPWSAPDMDPGIAPDIAPGMDPDMDAWSAPGIAPGMDPDIAPDIAPDMDPWSAPGIAYERAALFIRARRRLAPVDGIDPPSSQEFRGGWWPTHWASAAVLGEGGGISPGAREELAGRGLRLPARAGAGVRRVEGGVVRAKSCGMDCI